MKKIIAIFLMIGSALFLAETAFAGKASVESFEWTAIIEKFEISQNRGETFVTIFEGRDDMYTMSDEASVGRFDEKNSKIPEGSYNFSRVTLTVTLWKILYDDSVNGAAPIMPDIDDRETYVVSGAMMEIDVKKGMDTQIYIHFDGYQSLLGCDARWNGVAYTLEDLRFQPVVIIYKTKEKEES
ncbi:MAG: hypothetical protein ABIJ27_00605 [Candidatus Omnitrophota bacterium]